MVPKRSVRFANLLGERARRQIARGAIFQHDAPGGQRFGQRRIVHHGDSVADALSAENIDGFADRLGAADFSRVANDTQSLAARKIERWAEVHGWKGELMASH